MLICIKRSLGQCCLYVFVTRMNSKLDSVYCKEGTLSSCLHIWSQEH
ncbi:hypothetical protein AB205_0006360 [Aquarana catesbeiana]|uniref:Uncharacterized protein n=1 Tax=Aquarana catesbeiana TaxID=8400 RepID=A0A2G9NBR9_AQUCT|nr:hypothetical protein AB205_0006360 [Aquarana catesbeiana]